MIEFSLEQVSQDLRLQTSFAQRSSESKLWIAGILSETLNEVSLIHNLGEFQIGLIDLETLTPDARRKVAATFDFPVQDPRSPERKILYNPDYLNQIMNRFRRPIPKSIARYFLRKTTAHELTHVHQADVDPARLLRERTIMEEAATEGEYMERYESSWIEREAEVFALRFLAQRESAWVRRIAAFMHEGQYLE